MSEECQMADQEDEDLTEEQKQLYRKTRVPHKFCPNCGTRNQAGADRCANCNKDISWMRVPEPIPYSEAPKEPPRSLPREQKVFTPRVVLVIAIIVALIFAFILMLVLSTRGKSAEVRPGLERAGRKADSLDAEPPATSGVVVQPHLVTDPLDVKLVYKRFLPAIAARAHYRLRVYPLPGKPVLR